MNEKWGTAKSHTGTSFGDPRHYFAEKTPLASETEASWQELDARKPHRQTTKAAGRNGELLQVIRGGVVQQRGPPPPLRTYRWSEVPGRHLILPTFVHQYSVLVATSQASVAEGQNSDQVLDPRGKVSCLGTFVRPVQKLAVSGRLGA